MVCFFILSCLIFKSDQAGQALLIIGALTNPS